MKKIYVLLGLVLIAASGPIANAQDRALKGEIRQQLRDIDDMVSYDNLSLIELTEIRDSLAAILEQPGQVPVSILCMKQSNGRYYPTNADNGNVIGSNSFQAGHDALSMCRNTLPVRGAALACYKQSSGRYYPTRATSGEVVGSDSFQAGHDSHSLCLQTLPANSRQRVACFKSGNGRFYPTNVSTGKIIGSDAFSAGHDSFSQCKEVIGQ